VDFDDVAPSGETFRGEVEAVDAERQILKNEVGRLLESGSGARSRCFAEEFAAAARVEPFGSCTFEMKFAAETLGVRRAPRRDREG